MHPSSPLSVRALTEQYRQGTPNPVGAAGQFLALTSQIPSCFITSAADRAMAEAAAAQRRYQVGTSLSALDGVPKNGMKPFAKTLDAAGIIAKTADDLRLPVSLLCRSPLPLDNNPGGTDLHFVFDESILDDRAATASVRENILRAIDRLRAAGAKVTAKRAQIFSDALNLLDQHGWLGAARILRTPSGAVNNPACRRFASPCRRVSSTLRASPYRSDRAVPAIGRTSFVDAHGPRCCPAERSRPYREKVEITLGG